MHHSKFGRSTSGQGSKCERLMPSISGPLQPDNQTYTAVINSPGLGQLQTPALQQTPPLFNDLVGGGEQIGRDRNAERLGGLEIDHHFVLGQRLHRQVGRLLALEDAIDIAGRAA